MQEQIIQLLIKARSSDLINSAEEQLTSLSESPEFLPALVSIYSNSEVEEINRLSALLYAQYVVNRYWENIPAELQNTIKSSLPIIISNWSSSSKTKKSMYHFIHLVISKNITHNNIDWPELPDLIFQFLSEGSENSCRAGLILSNSLCGSIKEININNKTINEWAVNFGTTLMPVLATLFSQCENYEFLSLGFHCVSRILRSRAEFDLLSFAENLIPIIEKSFLINNYENRDEYFDFSKQALKFSIQYLARYMNLESVVIPIEVLGQYLETIQHLLPLEIPVTMKCDMLKVMCEIFKNPETWIFIGDNLIDFLTNLILPLYSLTPDDFSSLENDPEEFICDLDRTFNSNFNDIRSSASQVILSLYNTKLPKNKEENEEEDVKEEENVYSQQIVDACRVIAGEMFSQFISLEEKNSEIQAGLFASFLMFSVVSKNMNYDLDSKLYTKFFDDISPLFDEDNTIARLSAFVLLSESSNVQAPPKLIIKCINHVVDDLPIVRYYAIIAASGLMKKSDNIQQYFNDPQVISAIFNSIFELSQQFHIPGIANVVSVLIDVFKKQIFPIAMSIFSSIMTFLSSSTDSIETMKSIITDSLDKLIEMISKNEEAVKALAPTFCEECLTKLQSIEDHEVFDLLLSTTKEIFDLLPFDPSMWPAAEMLIEKVKNDTQISVTDPVRIISHFVMKDDEFTSREVMPIVVSFCIDQMNEKIYDFDSWSAFAILASNIIMRLKGNSNQLLEPLATMTVTQIEAGHYTLSFDEITTLVNVLLLTDFGAVSRILGEKFPVFIEFWIENQKLPESLITLVTCFDSFSSNSEVLLRALISTTSSVISEIIDEFDSDEIDESTNNFPWFNFAEKLLEFTNVLSSISQKNQSLYSQFLDEIPEGQKKITEITEFANEFANKTK